jgi:hypothetical protein
VTFQEFQQMFCQSYSMEQQGAPLVFVPGLHHKREKSDLSRIIHESRLLSGKGAED